MYVDPTHPHVVTRYYPAINTWHADDYSGGVHHRHVYTPHRDDPSNGHYILWRFGSGGAYRYVTGTISADNWLTIVARINPRQQRQDADRDLRPASGGTPDPDDRAGRDTEPSPGVASPDAGQPGVHDGRPLPAVESYTLSYRHSDRGIYDGEPDGPHQCPYCARTDTHSHKFSLTRAGDR